MAEVGGSTGAKVLKGSAWIFGVKVFERTLGIVSTVILARLLQPSDYGLVAMAMSLVAVLEIFRSFNFEAALIQRPDVLAADYHTAWTLNVAMGGLLSIVCLLLARPLAEFYREPALVEVILVLALVPLVSSAYNIGLAQYRKQLKFRPEFIFFASRKLATILVTIPIAFFTRSYWALVIGIVTGQLVGTVVSYRLHEFRPRFNLSSTRSLLNFSVWTLIGGGLTTARVRVSHFVLGRVGGPHDLGAFAMASDIATMPTTELVMPLNRAIFPAYAGMAKDPATLRRTYLRVIGMIALVTTPTAIGVYAVADLVVPLLLGDSWHAVTPLLGPLGVFGLMMSLQTNANAIYWGMGRPRFAALTSALLLLFLIVPLIPMTTRFGAMGTAISCMIAATVSVPITFWLIGKLLNASMRDFTSQLWRPAVAAGVMYFGVRSWISAFDSANAWMLLGSALAVGALLYSSVILLLWMFSGKPDSAESFVNRLVRERLQKARTAS
jgi:lipopolysaccharide exporter